MSLVSFTPIADGVTAVNAAATNTPLSTIYNDYNGNITDANISASAAIAFSKISGGSSTALGAWPSWTPIGTNITIGNGTVVAKYLQIGKFIKFTFQFTFGSTSSMGTSPHFTLPVTSVAYTQTYFPLGTAIMALSTGSVIPGLTIWDSTTTFAFLTSNVTSTYPTGTGVNATTPFTWATGSMIMLNGEYQAA